jgi:hypothetical protein
MTRRTLLPDRRIATHHARTFEDQLDTIILFQLD